jgi:hypothetical protein
MDRGRRLSLCRNYVGPQQIASGVFQRLATEWDGYSAKVHTYLADGDRVASRRLFGNLPQDGQGDDGGLRSPVPAGRGQITSMEQYVCAQAGRWPERVIRSPAMSEVNAQLQAILSLMRAGQWNAAARCRAAT